MNGILLRYQVREILEGWLWTEMDVVPAAPSVGDASPWEGDLVATAGDVSLQIRV